MFNSGSLWSYFYSILHSTLSKYGMMSITISTITDTCSFLVFFLGTGSLPLSDSDLLLTDLRCSFLSWEPESTKEWSEPHFWKRNSQNMNMNLCFANLVDCSDVIQESMSAVLLPLRSFDWQVTLSCRNSLPPLHPHPHLLQGWVQV